MFLICQAENMDRGTELQGPTDSLVHRLLKVVHRVIPPPEGRKCEPGLSLRTNVLPCLSPKVVLPPVAHVTGCGRKGESTHIVSHR